MIVLLCSTACAAHDGDQPDTDGCKPKEEIDENARVEVARPGGPYDWSKPIEEDGKIQVTAFFYRECIGDQAQRTCTARMDGKQVVVTTARYTDTCEDTGRSHSCEAPYAHCGDFQLAPGAYELVYDHCTADFTVPGIFAQCI